MKDFFTPSYWLSGAEEEDGDTVESGMNIEENAALVSSHQYPRADDSNKQQALSTQHQPPISNQNSSIAWKKNLIALNEEMETGPSWAFQNEADTVLGPPSDSGTQSSSQSSSTNAQQHKTKIFIPATSVSTPQHSTPVKKQGTSDNLEVISGQLQREDVTRKTETVQSSLDQQERTTRVEKGPMSSSSSIHQHGSMLTPPG